MSYADPRVRKSGVDLIAAERERQKAIEGWTQEHDDAHEDGQLAVAAAELAFDAGCGWPMDHPLERDHCGSLAKYGRHGSKPNPIRALTIAGALIAAEIDRLTRTDTRGGTDGD